MRARLSVSSSDDGNDGCCRISATRSSVGERFVRTVCPVAVTAVWFPLTDSVARTLFDGFKGHRQSDRGEEESGWVLLGVREERQALALATLPAGTRRRAGVAHVQFNGEAQGLASRMLGQLVALHKRLQEVGGRLVLCEATPFLHEFFETANLPGFLCIRQGEAEAVAVLTSPAPPGPS